MLRFPKELISFASKEADMLVALSLLKSGEMITLSSMLDFVFPKFGFLIFDHGNIGRIYRAQMKKRKTIQITSMNCKPINGTVKDRRKVRPNKMPTLALFTMMTQSTTNNRPK